MDQIEQAKAARFKFLHKLWEVSGGDMYKWPNMWAIGQALGLSRDDTQKVFTYLKGEGLAEAHALGGIIGITHRGIKEIEAALTEPDQPTHYFPAVNIINVENMHGGQIQQGSHGSTQTGTFNFAADSGSLRSFVERAKSDLPRIQSLDDDQKAEAAIYIAAVDGQAKLKKPNEPFIKRSLESLRAVIEVAAGDMVAVGLLEALKVLLGTR